MEVKAIKTFLNSRTREIIHAGSTFEADDSYAGDLEKRGIVEQAGASSSASETGAVPQPLRTAAMAAAPGVITGKSVAGGRVSPSSSLPAAPASAGKTVVTPPPPGKR